MDEILNGIKPEYNEGFTLAINNAHDLINREFSVGNSLCKAILCLFIYFEPKEFNADKKVILDNSWIKRADSKNFHHFFPRSYLSKNNIYNENSMMNITLVSDSLNKRTIGSKAPSRYIGTFIDDNEYILKQSLKTHLISDYKEFGILNDDYQLFLQKRAELVFKELQKRIHSGYNFKEEIEVTYGDKRIKPGSHYGNELVLKDTISECNEYIHLIDHYFNDKGIEFLYEGINTNKIKEIFIISNAKNIKENTRNNFKNFKKELSEKYGINAEWRCMIDIKDIKENHDRYLLSQNKSFLFTSPDVISRGQNSHIVLISDGPNFEKYRENAIDLVHDRNKIKEFQEHFKINNFN